MENTTQISIEEGNKLIAEFMEVKFINGVYGNCISAMPMKPFTSDTLKYNYSWDWLMPVVEKINSKGLRLYINSTNGFQKVRFTDQMDNYIAKVESAVTLQEALYSLCLKTIDKLNQSLPSIL